MEKLDYVFFAQFVFKGEDNMVCFDTIVLMNKYTGKDGEIACVGCDRYRFNTSEKSWKPYSPIRSSLASSLDLIKRSGTFRTTLNSGNSLSITNTDPLLSNFTSNKLMSSLLGKQPGRWYAFCDLYGSEITPINSDISTYITNNKKLQMTAILAGNSTLGEYPYSGVGCDLTYNEENIAQSTKIPINIFDYSGIIITYWSNKDLKLCLQSIESGDGADWFYLLPSTSGIPTQVTLLWPQFAQPTWASGTQIRTIPIDRMTNITFQYDTENSTITFGLENLYLKGSGQFLQQGITLDTIYEDKCLEEIESWFSTYYIESSDSRYRTH